jgi:hypothetical protein
VSTLRFISFSFSSPFFLSSNSASSSSRSFPTIQRASTPFWGPFRLPLFALSSNLEYGFHHDHPVDDPFLLVIGDSRHLPVDNPYRLPLHSWLRRKKKKSKRFSRYILGIAMCVTYYTHYSHLVAQKTSTHPRLTHKDRTCQLTTRLEHSFMSCKYSIYCTGRQFGMQSMDMTRHYSTIFNHQQASMSKQ